jgi:amino acid adenylation domain-containing protein
MPEQAPALSADKLLLLQRRLKGTAGKTAVERRIPALRGADSAPLSSAQYQMWLIDQMTPGCAAYNLPVAYRILGNFNIQALEMGFREIIRRHGILRTTFETKDGQPVQIIHPPWELLITQESLQRLPIDKQQTELHSRLTAESIKSFDLASLPLLRASVFRLNEFDHVLLINIHHIVADGLSINVIWKELRDCYSCCCNQEKPNFADLPIQYADFTIWERENPARMRRDEDVSFWKRHLAGDLPVLELPWNKPRPTVQSFKGSNVFLHLPAPLCAQLQHLGAGERSTFFTVILASFYAMLRRWSGISDIIVGVPVALRNANGTQALIGNFLNILALRCDLSEDPPFKQLLRTVRSVVLDAFSHQELPFEQVVEQLRFQRDPSRNPVFQTMLQVLPRVEAALPGLEVTDFHFDLGFSQFDLSLHLYEAAEGYKARFEYCSDLFNHETIERFAGHFLQLLNAVVANPETQISGLQILSQAERRKLVLEWNSTAREYPSHSCLPGLFEAQAARCPEAIAVVFGDSKLTYGRLNKHANQVAAHLRKLGAGPDSLVGICVDRSLEMVIGLLGILKSGAAYVPLDPAYPAERQAFMLEDSRMPILVTKANLLERLPLRPPRTLCLDCDWGQIRLQSEQNAPLACGPQSLAYVLYTSGSTGQPKGVRIGHRALVNFLASMASEPGMSASDILVAVTTLSFDIAGLELWLPLSVGARVIIASAEAAMDAASLGDLVDQSRATVMQATPATWRMLLERGWRGSPGLKILCGGEAWSEDLVQQLLPRCASLWNMYGPTETTIWSAVSKIETPQKPLIGRPIANTQFYVLDPHLQPVPIGVPGELHIGGVGLAQGYLSRPELTKERFILDPFSSNPDARLYKTGDLVRYRPEGTIEFLGRMDNQVKLRGYRIELEEVEAVLRRCPGVRECVAVVREDRPGEKRLVAYVAGEEKAAPGVVELQALLKQKLPDYMVPSVFVTLLALPLTPNGKIDRKALPVPEASKASQENAGYVAPRTSTEKLLACIWSEVLDAKQVGIHDSFFELGGHSLLAARVQVRVEKVFDRRLPLAAFFQASTVAKLAELLNASGAAGRLSHVFAPGSPGDKPPVLCLHSLFLSRRLAKHLGPTRPVYGIDSPIDDEMRHFQESRRVDLSIEELATRYLTTIKRVQPSGPYNLLGVCFGGVLAFEVAQQLIRAGEQVMSVILLDAFYYPGRYSPVRRWATRWRFHARQVSDKGLDYVQTKLQKRRESRDRHRSQQEMMRARDAVEAEELPFVSELVKRYRSQRYAGRVVLFRAVTEADPFRFDFSGTNGWESILGGELHVEQIQSSHMGIGLEPQVGEVARKLEDYLSRIEEKHTNVPYGTNDSSRLVAISG